MKSYSPTQTERFLKCPMLWWLTQHGWESRIQTWQPRKLIGSAIHAGLARYYVGAQRECGEVSECEDVAIKALREGWQEQDAWSLGEAETQVRRGLALGQSSSQLADCSVVTAELDLGGRYVDVVLQGPDGLIIDDNKVTLFLETSRIPQRLSEYEHSWQLRDYAYHAWQYFRELVAVRILLIVLAPRRQAILYPLPQLTEDTLTRWYEEACQVWSLMAEYQTPVARPPWKNLTSCSDRHQHFGVRCEMYEGCHELQGDESKFDLYYHKRTPDAL